MPWSWRSIHHRACAALALIAVSSLVGCADAFALHGTVIEPARAAPPVRLARSDGSVFDLSDERGRVVLLYFGYTRCPDVCPLTLATWTRVRRALGEDTSRVRFAFVSVDPDRDSPAAVQAYVQQFDPGIIGLTGPAAAIALLERSYMSTSYRSGAGAEYMVSHGTRSFLIDRSGQLRTLYSADMDAEMIVTDIRRLLRPW